MTSNNSVQKKHLAIVVPCYNESEMLPLSLPRLRALCTQVEQQFPVVAQILLVDDGSADQTWEIIEQAVQSDPHLSALKLAHNVGHQHALWAGLEWAVRHADVSVTIDADLQDDEKVILTMLEHYLNGYDIVYGVRQERGGDSFFKRSTAQGYYKLMRAYGIDLLYNHADFRLLSNKALQALMAYTERNLFLRGIVRQIGLPSTVVKYNQNPREAGTTKYPLHKMLALAIDGITSFSVRPLRLMILAGGLCFVIAVAIILYALVGHFQGHTISGWTSLITSLWFLGGLVLLGLGIIGEYVGKIYLEVKHRPHYFIEKEIGNGSNRQATLF